MNHLGIAVKKVLLVVIGEKEQAKEVVGKVSNFKFSFH